MHTEITPNANGIAKQLSYINSAEGSGHRHGSVVTCLITVNALINEPLKNNYNPQRRLVLSEKNYFGTMGVPYLGRRLQIRAQLTPFREVKRAEYGYTDNDRI